MELSALEYISGENALSKWLTICTRLCLCLMNIQEGCSRYSYQIYFLEAIVTHYLRNPKLNL